MKKTIFTSIVFTALVMPGLVRAAYTASVSQNNIKVTGDCSKNVLITLAKANDSGKIVYSGGATCIEKKFYFSDDLLKWEMDDGRYNIIINGQKSGKTVERKAKNIEIKDDDQETLPKVTNGSSTEEQDSPDVIFLKALANLQKSLLDMQVAVSQTTYHQAIKNSLETILDSLQSMTIKITDILWSADNSDGSSSEEADLPSEEKSEKTVANENLPATKEDIGQTEVPKEPEVQISEDQLVQPSTEIYLDPSSLDGLDVSTSNDAEETQ